MSIAGKFDPTSFAEGRFRRAYMGEYTAPREKVGQKCVVKELKESYTWNPNDWDSTVEIQEESQKLAEGFNKYSRTNYPIKFTDVHIVPVSSRTSPTVRPKVNEYVVVEDFIPGKFKKWLNNYGYISDEVSFAKSMPAFAHWSWWHTNGEKMIADLQGVHSNDSYTLTDPVLMSGSVNGRRYGCTDTGVEGIAIFFLKHKCNEFCSSLPKPTLYSLGIPQSQIQSVTKQLEAIFNATAYSHELKLPFEIRSRLVEPLKSIACGY
jgi:hypothetical protein